MIDVASVTTRILCPLLVWSLAGCVSANAGKREARAIAGARLHVDAADTSDEAAARTVDQLLGAPLTATSAVQIAVLRSPEVRAALAHVGLARADLIGAMRLPNPSLEGGLRFRGTSSDPDIQLGASIDLRDLILLPIRTKVASDGLDADSIEAAARIMDVGLRARLAFVDHVAALQTRDLEAGIVEALDAASELSGKIVEAGNSNPLLGLGDRALLEEGRLELERAEAEVMASRSELNGAMGLLDEDASRWTATARLNDPPTETFDADEVAKKALEVNLELAVAQARSIALSNQTHVARFEGALPRLEVGVSAERDPEGWGVGPALTLGIPIFYQGEGEIARVEAAIDENAAIERSITGAISTRARALVALVESARRRCVRYVDVVLPLRQRIVDETQLLYNGMGTSAFELLGVKREAIRAASGYVMALRDYWRARGELDLLLAGHLR